VTQKASKKNVIQLVPCTTIQRAFLS
jgi:hypothetical protein